MTQRKLTAESIAKARRVYKEIGGLYSETDAAIELVDASRFLSDVISYGTSDGKPLAPVERVPTAADIGKKVKVRDDDCDLWLYGKRLVGFDNGRFVIVGEDRTYVRWQYCIIDQEAGQ